MEEINQFLNEYLAEQSLSKKQLYLTHLFEKFYDYSLNASNKILRKYKRSTRYDAGSALVHELYVKFYDSKTSRFPRDESEMKRYIYQTLENLMRDKLRNETKHKFEDVHETTKVEEFSRYKNYHIEQYFNLVSTYIKPKMKEVITLLAKDGYTTEVVSKRLNISHDKVRQDISRHRKYIIKKIAAGKLKRL